MTETGLRAKKSELEKAIISLEEAIELYKKSKDTSSEQKAFRDACIQRFEYCIESCWKISMRVLGSNVSASKPAIREMARNNLIQDPEVWFEFIQARNETSHSYDETVAKKVFDQVLKFLPHAKQLIKKLESV